MNEVKRDRFIRIAEQRTQKVLDDLKSLSKCASNASYEYTAEEAQQIISAIEGQLQVVRNSFAGAKRFSLSCEPENENKCVSVSNEKTSQLIGCYIDELEEQEVPHVEIVRLLLDIFSKTELEAMGHGEFIEDCF